MTPRPRATDRLPVRIIATPMRGHRTYLDLIPTASPASTGTTTSARGVEAVAGANRGRVA